MHTRVVWLEKEDSLRHPILQGGDVPFFCKIVPVSFSVYEHNHLNLPERRVSTNHCPIGRANAAKSLTKKEFLMKFKALRNLMAAGAAVLALAPSAQAQTDLAPGDLTFVHYDADGTNDFFSFLLLADVDASTTIRFTDNGWLTVGGFRSGEGIIEWTSGAAMTAGTVITISTSPVTASLGSAAAVGSAIAFATAGDQVFAYQSAAGTLGEVLENELIAGLNMDGAWITDPLVTLSSNTSFEPATLAAVNATFTLTTEVDNARYDCTNGTSASSAAGLRTLVHTEGSWATDDATAYGAPDCTSFTIATATAPTVVISTASTTVSGAFVIDIAFSEDVTGLFPYELAITNAIYSNATTIDAANYQLTLTPQDGGDVTVMVPAAQAQSVSAGLDNEASNMLTVYFDGIAPGTCSSVSANGSREWIQRVTLKDAIDAVIFENISGKDQGYGDYTAVTPAMLVAGETYTLVVRNGRDAADLGRMQSYKAWIDFNRDGDFLDAGEQVLSNGLTADAQVRGTFSLGDITTPGLAMMRVQMRYNGPIYRACQDFEQGEVEDYVVNLASPIAFAKTAATRMGASDDAVAALGLYPNPASGQASLRYALASPAQVQVAVYDLQGRVVRALDLGHTAVAEATLSLEGLAKGVYAVRLVASNGEMAVEKLVVE
jgi:hypothetical protein